jgi:DnaJ-class molecular chaperone
MYDKYGDACLASDFRGEPERQIPKNRPTEHQLSLTLEELFTGCSKTLRVRRSVFVNANTGENCETDGSEVRHGRACARVRLPVCVCLCTSAWVRVLWVPRGCGHRLQPRPPGLPPTCLGIRPIVRPYIGASCMVWYCFFALLLLQLWETCSSCEGQGARMQMIRRGSYILQQQVPCEACQGQSHILNAAWRLGKKAEDLVCHVDKGSKAGDKIKFRNKGNMMVGALPGDIVVTLTQKPHALFTRGGCDLLMKKTISLGDALCGFRFKVPHLNGRTLTLQSRPGQVVSDGEFLKVANEGFPVKGDAFETGECVCACVRERASVRGGCSAPTLPVTRAPVPRCVCNLSWVCGWV